MIYYRDFAFASPPRTGTTWFIKAAAEAGLGAGQKAGLHTPPPEKWSGYLVSMIRHPYHWLEAYYHVLNGAAIGVSCVDMFVEHSRRSKDFNEFIRRYIRHCPGAIGDMFDRYGASTVMRVEDLPHAGVEFFESLGVSEAKLSRVRELPPQNKGKRTPHKPNPYLLQEVVKAERDFCDRYEYF